MTLTVDPEAGYAAIRWFGMDPPEGLYVTHNSEVEPQVDLLTDGGTPNCFPRSAALSLGDIRKALVEFVSTGKRPVGVNWEWFDRL
ncbi:hypothetical protein CDG81_03945 [Actinopolyspora erythraea]|uniref:Immunity protein Imm1 n=1 Tax=Actinopolyspora erythraea TaxID=414996 RepID=A0A099D2W9_9ACTN|nr:Imm1 family immunity protein [Actinopolyspora erythraea]ASU77603.1 hypothetical protein CDG81_03945 [Actinopolyspora erythraea]KGI80399.1 hypothetical protein IL38_17005 [Actinopolyspora erythraea]